MKFNSSFESDLKFETTYNPILLRNPCDLGEAGYTLEVSDASLLITLYLQCQSPEELAEMISRVLLNIQFICDNTHKDYWERSVVYLVLDGRASSDYRLLEYLRSLGLYSESAISACLAKFPIEHIGCHMFQGVLPINRFIPDSKRVTFYEHNYFSVLVAVKEHQSGNLDSEKWVFEGFCQLANFDFVITMQGNCTPHKDSFYRMLEEMENPDIGIAYADLRVKNASILNIVSSAEKFRRCTISSLEKPADSLMGTCSDDDIKFAMYRLRAVNGTPLKSRFTSLSECSPYMLNQNVSSEKVLALETFLKSSNKFRSVFSKGAVADVDSPETIGDLVESQKLSFNHNFLGSLNIAKNYYRLARYSNHSIIRKFLSLIHCLYYLIVCGSQWFSLAIFALLFNFMLMARPEGLVFDIVANVSFYFAFIILGMVMVYGLSGRSADDHPVFYAFSTFLLTSLGITAFTFFTWGNIHTPPELYDSHFLIIFAFLSTGSAFLFANLISGNIFRTLISSIHYILLIPLYNLVIPIYSICNLNEFERIPRSQKTKKYMKELDTFRLVIMTAYVLTNGAIISVFVKYDLEIEFSYWFALFCLKFQAYRVLGTSLFMFSYFVERTSKKLDNYARTKALVKTFLLPFLPSSWLCLANILVLQPVFTALAMTIFLVTSVCSLVGMIVYPVGFTIAIFASAVLRWFMIIDLRYSAGRVRIPFNPMVRPYSCSNLKSTFLSSITDRLTLKSVLYLTLIKPILVIAAAALGYMALVTVLLVAPERYNIICFFFEAGCYNIHQGRFLALSIASIWILFAIAQFCSYLLKASARNIFGIREMSNKTHIPLRSVPL